MFLQSVSVLSKNKNPKSKSMRADYTKFWNHAKEKYIAVYA